MKSRLFSLVLLIPSSWLLYSTLALMAVFIILNIQGWSGILVYLPLGLLAVDLVVLPRVLLSDRVIDLLQTARRLAKRRAFEEADQCFEQALILQRREKRLGLSLVLSEYSRFLRSIDEESWADFQREARQIQIAALKGEFQDDFDEEQF
ncbi:MAG: hypothetical protein KC652_23355 [Cyanobacteria bacterium HKST-UBA01]|nr:hypothetical protein [Cyanobacteria bacterium HKST-UBA01]